MARFFNTAGPCYPGLHYMLPPEPRLPEIRRLVAQSAYFVVHAPRQSGKTTCLSLLAKQLTAEGEFACLYISCESGASLTGDVEIAVSAILSSIERHGSALPEQLRPPAAADFAVHAPHTRLLWYLTAWSERCPLPVVLFLDEIDALSGEGLLAILHQLRQGHTDRPRRFPQSLALIGLRDVRDYKIAQNPALPHLGTASPFNIKVDSLILKNFTPAEVAALLGQHTEDTGQIFQPEAVALVSEYTRGQPWLVNALARQLTEQQAPDRATPIEAKHVEAAKEALILRRDTHLDSLVARLREPRVQRVLEPILSGELAGIGVSDEDLGFVEDLGLITREGGLEIANPIYREVIPRALSSATESTLPFARRSRVDAFGRLEVEKLLVEFAEFWRESAESLRQQQAYPEAAAQLVFMAYLQRLVNGGGTIQREYAVGSGRIDLCVSWPLPSGGQERFAFEIKVWREGRPDPEAKGLDQLATYLDRLSLESGHLLIFDQRRAAVPGPGKSREIEHRGRRIAVWRF